MSSSNVFLIISVLASTAGTIEARLSKLADELSNDPEVVASLLTRWDEDVLSQAFKLAGEETAIKTMAALAEVRFGEYERG